MELLRFKTDSLLIDGECLQVMRALKPQVGEVVDLIYFDPPFGKGADLSLKVRDPSSGEVERIPAFEDTWPDELDSYLQWCEARLQACLERLSLHGWLFVHTALV